MIRTVLTLAIMAFAPAGLLVGCGFVGPNPAPTPTSVRATTNGHAEVSTTRLTSSDDRINILWAEIRANTERLQLLPTSGDQGLALNLAYIAIENGVEWQDVWDAYTEFLAAIVGDRVDTRREVLEDMPATPSSVDLTRFGG